MRLSHSNAYCEVLYTHYGWDSHSGLSILAMSAKKGNPIRHTIYNIHETAYLQVKYSGKTLLILI